LPTRIIFELSSNLFSEGERVKLIAGGQPRIGFVLGMTPKGYISVALYKKENWTYVIPEELVKADTLWQNIDPKTRAKLEKWNSLGTAIEEIILFYGWGRKSSHDLWIDTEIESQGDGNFHVRATDGSDLGYKLHIVPSINDYNEIVRDFGKFIQENQICAKASPTIKHLNFENAGKQFGKVFTIYPKSKDEMVKIVQFAQSLYQSGFKGISTHELEELKNTDPVRTPNLLYELPVPETGDMVYYTLDVYNRKVVDNGYTDASYPDINGYALRKTYHSKYWGFGPLDNLWNNNPFAGALGKNQLSSPEELIERQENSKKTIGGTKMANEYIVETVSGSLYHVTYSMHFFEHGGRFNCRQLVGRTVDLSKDDQQIIAFGGQGGASGADNLDLNHFILGVQIIMANGSRTSPIAKIFQRIG